MGHAEHIKEARGRGPWDSQEGLFTGPVVPCNFLIAAHALAALWPLNAEGFLTRLSKSALIGFNPPGHVFFPFCPGE